MALTLAESAKLATDMVQAGVIETIIKEEHVLDQLPFIQVVGNNFVYNRLNTEPTISFFNVGDSWTESTPDFTQVSVQLKILGGDADVDNFLAATRSNIQDLEAAIVSLKAKAVQQKFDDTFVNGDTGVDAKAFDGIDKLCTGGQSVSMGANGGTLTLEKLDELLDKIKGGRPDLIIMSKRSRRKLTSLSRATGSGFLETDRDQFGQVIQLYNGIPIGVNDYIADNKTVGTSTHCSLAELHYIEGGAGRQPGD